MSSSAIPIGSSGGKSCYTFEISIDGILSRISSVLAADQGRFFLRYSLFGIVISSEPFVVPGPNTTVPFSPLRDCFALRSCISDLKDFFSTMSPIYVELHQVTNDSKNAEANLPIAAAAISPRQMNLALRDGFAETEVVGPFLLSPVDGQRHKFTKLFGGPKSSLWVQGTVTLRADALLTKSVAEAEAKANALKEELKSKTVQVANTPSNVQVIKNKNNSPIAMVVPPGDKKDPQLRHYRLSIDIRSIRGLTRQARVYLQYSCPRLGSSGAPFRTRPTIEVLARSETAISHGFCLFEFKMSRSDLLSVLNTPLVVELRGKNVPGDDDELIGMGVISLSTIWQAPLYYRCSTSGKTFPRKEEYYEYAVAQGYLMENSVKPTPLEPVELRAHDSYIPLLEPNKQQAQSTNEIGQIRTVIYLEHLGVHDEGASKISPTPAEMENEKAKLVYNNSSNNQAPSMSNESFIRQDRVQPSQVDSQRQDVVIAEALRARRQYEKRAKELKESQAEYKELDNELRKALAATQKRERRLTEAQASAQRMIREKTEELDRIERKLRSDTELQISLERDKTEAMSKRLKNAEAQLEVALKRSIRTEEDFAEYRRQQRNTPEATLRAEIVSLQKANIEVTMQVEKLRVEIEKEKASKMDLKRQLLQVSSAFQRAQQWQVERQQRENNTLRLKYAAQEQRMVLDGDRMRIERLRKELDDLRREDAISQTFQSRFANENVPTSCASTPKVKSAATGTTAAPLQARSNNVGDSKNQEASSQRSSRVNLNLEPQGVDELDASFSENEIARLQREREQLVSTAGYGEFHPLVVQIDAAIAELNAN
eukprot:g4222.t1